MRSCDQPVLRSLLENQKLCRSTSIEPDLGQQVPEIIVADPI
jgi:hypothetical protein